MTAEAKRLADRMYECTKISAELERVGRSRVLGKGFAFEIDRQCAPETGPETPPETQRGDQAADVAARFLLPVSFLGFFGYFWPRAGKT